MGCPAVVVDRGVEMSGRQISMIDLYRLQMRVASGLLSVEFLMMRVKMTPAKSSRSLRSFVSRLRTIV